MSSFVIEGTLTVDISGLEGLAGEIRSVSIKALQGEIRKVADQILRELVEKDWPAGRASPGYVSTGELVDAINVTGGGTSLSIEMDGSRMSMSPLAQEIVQMETGVELKAGEYIWVYSLSHSMTKCQHTLTMVVADLFHIKVLTILIMLFLNM